MKGLNLLEFVVLVLVIIGGLNWGLVGLFGFNLVHMLVGAMPLVEKVVYVVVGLAALYLLFLLRKLAKK